jgi:hypothetical protein
MHHSRSHGWLLACFACLLGQSYYAAVLGCNAVTTGKHLAVTGVVRFIGNFLGATLETTLQKLGFKQLNIRKSVCLVNNTLQAGFCLGFGLSRTPLMATIMNCGVCLCDCFQGIGFSQNYYEVGGPDTATLTSVGNVFASLGEQRASERAIATQRNVSVLFCSVLFCSVLFCSVLVWSGLVWSGLVWSGLEISQPALRRPSTVPCVVPRHAQRGGAVWVGTNYQPKLEHRG